VNEANSQGYRFDIAYADVTGYDPDTNMIGFQYRDPTDFSCADPPPRATAVLVEPSYVVILGEDAHAPA
jgi:hypothetical protein